MTSAAAESPAPLAIFPGGSESVLFREDWSGFPVGLFPYDYSPLGEYHCILPEGHRGAWTEMTIHHRWRRNVGWWIGEDGGRKFMEQAAQRDAIPSMLAAGDYLWSDISIRAEVETLSDRGAAGIAFRFTNTRQYYELRLEHGLRASIVKVDFEKETVLAAMPLNPPEKPGLPLVLEIRAEGESIVCRVDGQTLPSASDDAFARGAIALVATAPARYHALEVTSGPSALNALEVETARLAAETRRLADALPKAELWRRIDLKDFGAGRSIRFGDLDGDGEIEILFAQCAGRQGNDSLAVITCLTAVKLSGEVLWQLGEPNPRHTLMTADLPFQIHDIDGDGRAEVVLCKDYHLRILDGATGRLKAETPTPMSQGVKEGMFLRLSGDSIAFADLAGRGARRDILIKNRYEALWAYGPDLKLLWSRTCKTGHYPFIADVDGDGCDEVLLGSNLLDQDGSVIWDFPTKDHVDTSAMISLAPGADPAVLLASSDDGLYFLDLKGNLLRRDPIGHAQDLAIGRFRPDQEGLQFFTKTFWGHPGVLFFYGSDLKLQFIRQGYPLGAQVYPINWSGDGAEHILLSAHPGLGGLMDGWGRRIPLLPDDGHPWLCCEALDVTGDARDEILCWDAKRLWIYTQDRPYPGQAYAPERLSHSNFSNYRCEISRPA